MSIPPDSLARGCAANFPQPVAEEDVREAQRLADIVHNLNCVVPRPPLVNPTLSRIAYRSSDDERDVTRHVFRWNTTHYEQVFQNGFHARPQGDTPDLIYYNLTHYINHSGRPLDPNRRTIHVFVSTSQCGGWRPSYSLQPEEEIQVYRYEIYAPGGILVAQTLGNLYAPHLVSQREVCFVAGIAPQYIRAAQLYIATGQAGSRFPRWRRAENIIRVNALFDPQSHPRRLLPIQRPILDYDDEDHVRRPLDIDYYIPELPRPEWDHRRVKRQVSDDIIIANPQVPNNDIIDWYVQGVANITSYIDAAFRSSRTNEAYLFMKNEYVLVDYAPGTTGDKILNGPLLICDGFPSLIDTAFGEYGIDCAFDSHHGNEAFIFSYNLCAYIDYAPGTTDDKILEGPITITDMFPFFKDTVFENGIDAAFTATARNEAYLFKSDQYALINYSSKYLIAIRKITEGFYSLRNTIFASGIDAAFASHRKDEAYIFKGDQYALINFAPGTTDDYVIGGVKQIIPNWPSLHDILPRKNRGLDVDYHHAQDSPEQDSPAQDSPEDQHPKPAHPVHDEL